MPDGRHPGRVRDLLGLRRGAAGRRRAPARPRPAGPPSPGTARGSAARTPRASTTSSMTSPLGFSPTTDYNRGLRTRPRPGNVAIVAQSGGLGFGILNQGLARGDRLLLRGQHGQRDRPRRARVRGVPARGRAHDGHRAVPGGRSTRPLVLRDLGLRAAAAGKAIVAAKVGPLARGAAGRGLAHRPRHRSQPPVERAVPPGWDRRGHRRRRVPRRPGRGIPLPEVGRPQGRCRYRVRRCWRLDDRRAAHLRPRPASRSTTTSARTLPRCSPTTPAPVTRSTSPPARAASMFRRTFSAKWAPRPTSTWSSRLPHCSAPSAASRAPRCLPRSRPRPASP